MIQKKGKMLGGNGVTLGQVVQDIVSKYGIMIIAFIFVCIIAMYAIINSHTIELFPLTYMILILAPILMIFILTLNLFGNSRSAMLFMKIIGGGIIMALVIYMYTLISGKLAVFSDFTKYTVYAFIGLLGLGIFYNSFLNYLSRLQGWGGFIAQLLFYLPCALYDFLLYLLDQFA
jgi:hypothetical protein